MTKPTPQQIAQVRNNARITQTAAATLVHASLRAWQKWEAGDAKMPPAAWELFTIKVKEIK
jgi:DNA-binding transcriptional regulator YiaG